ncbi:MAG TPA: STAS domain-containing protein [Vicinamibacterales bacterium]|nr:STAS domain-containing protein [Vicinamibacterales bacterium]
MVWELRITRDSGETTRIGLQGRLSGATSPQLAAALGESIAAGSRRIVLDLKDLNYISSGGIVTIQSAAARVLEAGGSLRLTGAQPAVRVALELAGLDTGFGPCRH